MRHKKSHRSLPAVRDKTKSYHSRPAKRNPQRAGLGMMVGDGIESRNDQNQQDGECTPKIGRHLPV